MRFSVEGKAQPAGSKKGFVVAGHVNIVDANSNAKPWKKTVADAARAAMSGQEPFSGPVIVRITFRRARPAGHFTSKGELSAEGKRHLWPTSKPDVLKLARGVEDAMTGIVYTDDALIVRELIEKTYGRTSEEGHMTWVEVNPVAQVDFVGGAFGV